MDVARKWIGLTSILVLPTLMRRYFGGLMKAFRALCVFALSLLFGAAAFATPFTETVPNGNGPIPATYPPVGGTMFVLIGINGNIYYQFVNPSTQFQGFAGTGTPTAFQGIPTFQLGPTQALNCGTVSCSTYFGGSIVEGYARLTVRDADACPGNFDYQDVTFLVNGIDVASLSDLAPNSVQRTNLTGTTQVSATENCFRNQGTGETSTSWFDLSAPLLADILAAGGTTPFIRDEDTGRNTTRGDNAWFFQDGVDATGTPEVAPGITIVKSADKTEYTGPNEIINYEFLVTNIGSVFLDSIVVNDSFITGTVTCPQTSLVTGASMVCTGSHTVSQANVDDDIVFVNTADVTAVPSEGTIGNVSGTLTIPGPDANNTGTITKMADIDVDLVLGNVVTYTYEVANTGNITMDNVTVSDAHNGSGTLSAVTPAPLSLAPGASQTFTATYTITQADIDAGVPITNTATMVATPKRGTFTPPTADESVAVTFTNSMTLDKPAPANADEDANGEVSVGDTLTYTVTMTNTGTQSQTGVVVSDPMLMPPSETCATVAPNATCVLTGAYTVTQADVTAGQIVNTASVVSDDITTPVSDGETTPINAPEMTISKPAPVNGDGDASGDVTLDDVLTYTITVTNTGTATLSGVVVSDPMLTPASETCATVAPNATCVLTGTYTVTQADVDAGSIVNTASGDSNQTDPITDDETTPVAQTDSLAIDKPAPANADDDASGDLSLNDVLTYTVTATNDGTTTQMPAKLSIQPKLFPMM